MSRTLDRLRRTELAPGVHLRKPDGTVHGPLDIGTLKQWSAHNRIPPGSEICRDGSSWHPANEMRELQLEWHAELPTGLSYGPFNILAVPILVEHGTIPDNARLTNALTGKSIVAADILKGHEHSRTVPPRKRTPVETPQPEQAPAAESAPRSGEAPPIPPEIFEKIASLEQQLDDARTARMAATESAAAKEHSLTLRISELTTLADSLSLRLQDAERELRQRDETIKSSASRSKEKDEQLQRRMTELERDAKENTMRIANLTHSIEEQRVTHRREAESLAARERELLSQLQKIQATRSEPSQERINELQEKLDLTTGKLTAAEKGIIERDRLCRELEIKSRTRDEQGEKRTAKLEEDLKAAREYSGRLAAEVDQVKKSCADLQRTAAAASSDKAAAEEKLSRREKELLKQLADTVSQLEASTVHGRSLSAEIANLENDRQKLAASLSAIEMKSSARETALSGEISELKSALSHAAAAPEREAELQRRFAALESDLTESAKSAQSAEQKLRGEIASLESSLAQANRQIGKEVELKRQVQALQDEVASVTASLGRARADLEAAEIRLSDAERSGDRAPRSTTTDSAISHGSKRSTVLARYAAVAGMILLAFFAGAKMGGIGSGTTESPVLPKDSAGAPEVGTPRPAISAPHEDVLKLEPVADEEPVQVPVKAPVPVPPLPASVTAPAAPAPLPAVKQAPQPTVIAAQPVQPAPPPTPPRPPAPWPNLDKLPGITVTATDDSRRLVFDDCIFSYFTIIRPANRDALMEIARRMRSSVADFTLEVEGHTDNVTLSQGAPFADNKELGMARAQAVADYLISRCGLPHSAIIVTSAGELNPPYPNTTPENQKKNRTVVITIRRAAAAVQ